MNREEKTRAIAADLPVRHEKMRRIMREKGVDAAILCSNANLVYATGTVIDGYAFLPADGDMIVFLRSGSPLVEEASVVRITRPEMIAQTLGDVGKPLPKRVALEFDETSHREWVRLSRLFPEAEVVDLSVGRLARAVKTDFEIALLEADGSRHAAAFARIPSLYKPGMRDLDFSAAIESMLRVEGWQGVFRTFGFRMEPIAGTLLAGDNGCAAAPYDYALGGRGLSEAFPLGLSGDVMKEGTTAMVDLSGNYSGYPVDLSRTYAVGKLPDQAYDLHKIALEILHEAHEMGKPGTPCSELYECAQKIVSHYHVESYFMGCEKQAKFIGHGFGLEINELPVITGKYKAPLEVGHVVALEPKFVLPGVGPLGCESSYVVKEDGMHCITVCDESLIDLLG